MTHEFPNMFVIAGPGSPSTLSNVSVANTQHIHFVTDLLCHLAERGLTRVEPTEAAQDAWVAHIADLARNMLRLQVDNYMVHVNADDSSRVFMPYPGGVAAYVEKCNAIVADGYAGFEFS